MLMGASSKYVPKRIAEYCDGWFPIFQDPARAAASGAVDYAGMMAQIRTAWQEAGREGQPDFTVFGVGPDPKAVEFCIEAGFNRVVFALPPADADTVMPMIENYASLAHNFS